MWNFRYVAKAIAVCKKERRKVNDAPSPSHSLIFRFTDQRLLAQPKRLIVQDRFASRRLGKRVMRAW